ncbi:MAG: alpha/beta hydrolase [Micrococcaceae bacterium]
MAAEGLIHRGAKALTRLRAEMRVRAELPERRRRVLDGTVHALKPDLMDAALAGTGGSQPVPRTLLDYDSSAPHVVIAVGELRAPTQVTWQIAGMGMGPAQAAWGAAREALQLHREQRALGAERPLVLAWLGYHPPSPVGVLSSRGAARAGQRLAEHIWTTSQLWEGESVPPWRGLDAHSYGAPVAVRALGLLAVWSQTRLDRTVPPAARIDTLVVSGSVGAPRRWWHPVESIPDDGAPWVTEIRARRDLLAPLGRALAGRRRIPVNTSVGRDVAEAGTGLRLAVGHNTHGGAGYRDPGTLSLRAIATATLGPPALRVTDTAQN